MLCTERNLDRNFTANTSHIFKLTDRKIVCRNIPVVDISPAVCTSVAFVFCMLLVATRTEKLHYI